MVSVLLVELSMEEVLLDSRGSSGRLLVSSSIFEEKEKKNRKPGCVCFNYGH